MDLGPLNHRNRLVSQPWKTPRTASNEPTDSFEEAKKLTCNL